MTIGRIVKRISYYICGHFYAWRYYDKQYLKGRWFEGKFNGIGARGWLWVTTCARSGIKQGNISQAPWPVDSRTSIVHSSNINFDVNDLNIFQSPGCYFQAHGRITIGKGTWIAPNVGIITSNHSINDLDKHDEAKSVYIGECCWIGMNSVILPGVTLGKHTIVGAGSVVTHSFPEGDCIIAGNPAKIIRHIRENINE